MIIIIGWAHQRGLPIITKKITLGVLKIFDVNMGAYCFYQLVVVALDVQSFFFCDKFHSLANHPKQRFFNFFLRHSNMKATNKVTFVKITKEYYLLK
jgi:hypothetical protein